MPNDDGLLGQIISRRRGIAFIVIDIDEYGQADEEDRRERQGFIERLGDRLKGLFD